MLSAVTVMHVWAFWTHDFSALQLRFHPGMPTFVRQKCMSQTEGHTDYFHLEHTFYHVWYNHLKLCQSFQAFFESVLTHTLFYNFTLTIVSLTVFTFIWSTVIHQAVCKFETNYWSMSRKINSSTKTTAVASWFHCLLKISWKQSFPLQTCTLPNIIIKQLFWWYQGQFKNDMKVSLLGKTLNLPAGTYIVNVTLICISKIHCTPVEEKHLLSLCLLEGKEQSFCGIREACNCYKTKLHRQNKPRNWNSLDAELGRVAYYDRLHQLKRDNYLYCTSHRNQSQRWNRTSTKEGRDALWMDPCKNNMCTYIALKACGEISHLYKLIFILAAKVQ